MKVLYLDESGDHSLIKIDPSYPMFVLGGVIVDEAYALQVIQPELDAFKRELFGTETLILHTSDLTRNRRGFEGLKDAAFRQAFYVRLNALMRNWNYEVVACAIRKDEHLARYGLAALDPYMLSLDVVVERFCMSLGDETPGRVVVEARGYPLDEQLQLAWRNVQLQGTRFLRGSRISRCIASLDIGNKHENIAGLQLADLVVSPIGRYVMGKRAYEDWQIIASKFRKRHGSWSGAGLVVLPKK
ncbi:MAG: DUF3800 domain-containing protein [Deinococcota bacterium]|nr:DUF3800 domain-containing protein [Deinococcota bacterium]